MDALLAVARIELFMPKVIIVHTCNPWLMAMEHTDVGRFILVVGDVYSTDPWGYIASYLDSRKSESLKACLKAFCFALAHCCNFLA